MKQHHRRTGAGTMGWTQVLRMHLRTANASKPKIKTFRTRRAHGGRNQLVAGSQRFHFGNGAIPVLIKIFRANRFTVIILHYLKRHIGQWHQASLSPFSAIDTPLSEDS